MFQSFRRHQHWIWVVLTVVIIISFVVFFSPNVRWSDDRPTGARGTIGGKPITTEQFNRAYQESQLHYLFMYGQWPEEGDPSRRVGFDVENETYNRLLLIEKLKELNFKVGTKEAAQWLKDNRLGNISIDELIEKVLPMKNMRESDLERYISHQIGIRHLIAVGGMAGRLVTPQEIEAAYRRENEPLAVDLVFFSATNHLTNVTVNPADLGTFFTNSQARYRLPDRVQVSYLKLEATNYLNEADLQLSKITNLSQSIDRLYDQRGTNYYKDEKGVPLDPIAAREKIRQEARNDLAVRAALRKANEFYEKIEAIRPLRAENLDLIAATNQLTVKTSAPFDETGPEDLEVPAQFIRNAFKLTPEEPLSPAVMAQDGVYLMALKARLPSENPPYESIKEKVMQDFRMIEARKLARQAAVAFQTRVTNEVAKGKTFAAVASEAKVKVVSPAPFTLSTRAIPELEERIDANSLKNEVSSMVAGQVSPVLSNREGNYLVHLQSRMPVDEAKMKDELAQYSTRLRQARQLEAFSDWFGRQAEQMRLVKPKGSEPTPGGE